MPMTSRASRSASSTVGSGTTSTAQVAPRNSAVVTLQGQTLIFTFDYQLNEETDLYFNLLYEDIDYALRQNVRSLHVGQTANEFKSRVGCYLEPRFFYVKARDPGIQFLVRAGSPYLFPPAPPIVERNLFRAE